MNLIKRLRDFSPHTLKAYRLQATLLIRYFNDIEIGTLTTDQLKCYLAESSEQLKPSSLAHRVRFLTAIFCDCGFNQLPLSESISTAAHG
jgi:integrase/recombinase XerD